MVTELYDKYADIIMKNPKNQAYIQKMRDQYSYATEGFSYGGAGTIGKRRSKFWRYLFTGIGICALSFFGNETIWISY